MGFQLGNMFVAPAGRSLIGASLAAALGAAACAGLPPGPPGWVGGDCVIRPLEEEPPPASNRAPMLRIGLPEAARLISHHADGDERIVWPHVDETLVATDCAGHPVPSLASSWTHSDSGHRWVFALRPGASFSDSTPVTSAAIRTSLHRRSVGGAPVDSVTETGDGRIAVHLAVPGVQSAAAFSDRTLAVRRVTPGSRSSVSTGLYRMLNRERDRVISLQSVRTEGENPGPAVAGRVGFRPTPRLHFEVLTASDALNALDIGWAAVLTRNRRVTEYASGIDRLSVVTLQWDRTYRLLVPDSSGSSSEAPPNHILETLARDAVSAQARAYPGTEITGEPKLMCEETSESAGPAVSVAVRRILYDGNDPTAAELAARLVALTGGRAASVDDGPTDYFRRVLGLEGRPEQAAKLRASSISAWAESQRRSRSRSGGSRSDGTTAYVSVSQVAAAECGRLPGYRVYPLINTRLSLIMDGRLRGVFLGAEGLPMFTHATMPAP
ncbi:MAG: ABC transporter substrate-binding protein [Gemmatimonadota bacterium]